MLTWVDLVALSDADKLRAWLPSRANATEVGERVLFMLPDVHESFESAPWPSSSGERAAATRERRAAMRSVLTRFVKGHVLNLRNDIKELGSQDADPSMRGFWEFRSQGPMSETRLFGYFALKGAFVATDFRSRGDFDGNPGEWKRTRHSSRLLWDSLTSHASPLQSPWPVLTRADLKEYIG
jgi:hypothetical protein